MKRKDDEEFIRVKSFVADHAQKAYESENYLEAFQVLHGWIENKLQELLMLTGSVDHGSVISKTWDIVNQINLITCAHTLYILSQIDESEYQKVLKFNVARNQLIHKIYHEPYEKIYNGYPKSKYNEAYKIGLTLVYSLQFKIDKKIEI